MRRERNHPSAILWQAVLFCGLAAAGCGRQQAHKGGLGVFAMGERVRVGPLIYTVQDTEWHDRLGEGAGLRMPQHRFLLVRLSITNSGIRDVAVPLMNLIGADGETHAELSDGKEVPEWLGLLRSVKAAATEHGRVLFDVPSGAYRLRVSAESETAEEPFALIEIPFQVPPAPTLPGVPVQ